MFAAAAYVSELLGTNRLPKTKKKEKKLEEKFKELNRDLDFVNFSLEKKNY